MLVFETGEILEEETAQVIIEQIKQCLHSRGVSVAVAKYLLDQAKIQVEKAKV